MDESTDTHESTTIMVDLKTPIYRKPHTQLIGLIQVVEGLEKGRLIALDPSTSILVGRSQECHVIFDDSSCSRKHAEILRQPDGAFQLVDLKSTNGTQINGVLLQGASPLKSGDRIQFGKTIVVLFNIVDEQDANVQMSLYNRATSDNLTGAANRYRFNESLERELAHRERTKGGLGLLMFDVDFFKKVNDTKGHPAGDAVLKEIGKRVRMTVRKEDLFARLGGEEFAILTRNNNIEELKNFGERIRVLMASKPVDHDGDSISFTVSVGMCFLEGDQKLTSKEFVEKTDRALYQAKQSGRNVCKISPIE